jgi:sulfonate transport system ATP-binding protein
MIKFDNVNVTFANGTILYQNSINLEFAPGEFVCIVGRSGSGKTVLLKTLLGNIQPTVGEVYINNEVVNAPSARVSVVYQDHFILPWLTLRENILLGQSNGAQKNLNNIANMLSIANHLDMYPKAVSIGTKQRASIARGLLADADIIVMDEPLSSVDEITAMQIRSDIAVLCQNKTTIYVTHNLNEALRLASRIVVINSTGVAANLLRSEINDVDELLAICAR